MDRLFPTKSAVKDQCFLAILRTACCRYGLFWLMQLNEKSIHKTRTI